MDGANDSDMVQFKLSNTHDFKIFTFRYNRRSNMPDYQTNSSDLTMTRFCSNFKVLISSLPILIAGCSRINFSYQVFQGMRLYRTVSWKYCIGVLF